MKNIAIEMLEVRSSYLEYEALFSLLGFNKIEVDVMIIITSHPPMRMIATGSFLSE